MNSPTTKLSEDSETEFSEESAYSEFIRRKKFTLLDGIRGLAILAVVWHHSAGANPITSAFFSRGYLGVDLFFVLSGFLITFLLIKERRETNNISLKNFYIRRSLRIFPLYFGFLGSLTIWLCLTSPREETRQILSQLPYYLLYLSNWIPQDTEQYFDRAWSLATEEQFYLIWPVLFVFLQRYQNVIFILTFAVILTLISFFPLSREINELHRDLLPFRTLLFGCLLAIFLTNPLGYKFAQRFLSHGAAIIAVACLMIFSIARIEGPILSLNELSIHLLMVLFLACAVVNESNFLKPILSWFPLKICGVVSYGIYIFHGQLWGVTNKLTKLIPIELVADSRITFFIVFLALSICVALLSFHFFEKWFLNIKERYSRTPN